MLLLVLFSAAFLLTVSADAANSITLTGAIVSSQFTCVAPCAANWNLVISKTDTVTQLDVPNDVVLQELLPPANADLRSFETFTAYDEKSRNFAVIAADYPKVAHGTFWVSTLNNDLTAATPVLQEVTIEYPVSSAPYPLNVAHLKMSRLINGADGVLYATFTNGEVHVVDVANKSMKRIFSVISDDKLLSNNYPAASWSQVYDPEQNALWSVVIAGASAYVVKSDMATLTNGDWIELTQVKGMRTGLSVETFINAHMVKLDENGPTRLVVMMESINDNVGFDEIVWVDTTTGQLGNIAANLMEYNCLLTCPAFECDRLRVSSFDPVTKKLYFQGHLVNPNKTFTLSLFYVYFFMSKITGTWEATVAPAAMAAYGYSGHQYVQIIA